MTVRATEPPADETFLIECFDTGARGGADLPPRIFATLAVARDDQILVLARGSSAESVGEQCRAAGFVVDRVVPVTVNPPWPAWPARRSRSARAARP